MSHEIKDDLPATSPTPKANKVAQSTGHAYMSELAIAQDDLLSLSHRLQSDSHIEHTWYTKLNLHVLPSTSTTSDTFDASTPKLYHMSNTSTSIPTMDKADVICLQPVSPADTLPNPRCEANCESYSSLLEVTANSLKDKANSEGNCTDVSSTGSYLKDVWMCGRKRSESTTYWPSSAYSVPNSSSTPSELSTDVIKVTPYKRRCLMNKDTVPLTITMVDIR